MKLARYMEVEKLTDATLAKKIKRDRSTVTKLRLGTIKPSWPVMVQLEKISEGLVKPSDFEGA